MITVEHLTKRYGDVLAVDDLSFTIEDGHIYGFLGPNGAGKSTTLNIMTGCLAPTGGSVKINEYDIFEDAKEAKKLLGYLPEIPPLYVDQTPVEYLIFVAEMKGVAKSELNHEVERVLAETHLEEMSNRLIRHLSKGYRQRVGIAQALLGNPAVIILDEPTVGLDPMQIIEIRELIAELGKKHTVILSSHILSEVQAICEKVLIIHKGKLVAFDDPEILEQKMRQDASVDIDVLATAEGCLDVIYEIDRTLVCEVENDQEDCCSITINTRDYQPERLCALLFHAFAAKGYTMTKLYAKQTSLEDIFIELTAKEETKHESSI